MSSFPKFSSVRDTREGELANLKHFKDFMISVLFRPILVGNPTAVKATPAGLYR